MKTNTAVFYMETPEQDALSTELEAKFGCHLRPDLTGVWLVDSESFSAVLMKPRKTADDFHECARTIAQARTQAAA